MATAVIARTLRALVALGAASWGCARPWEPVSLQGLTAGGSIEEARLTLRDRQVFTIVAPRVAREAIHADVRARCFEGRCAELAAPSPGVFPLTAVARIEVRYVRPPPSVRVDLDLGAPFILSAPGTGLRESALGGVAALRFATRSGFGASVSVGGAGRLDMSRGSVVEAYVSGWTVDVMALYRVRLAGDDRRGLGVDVAAGLSSANLSWHEGHGAYSGDCGWFSWSCTETLVTPYTAPPRSFTSGARVGPALGLGVDGRAGAFVGGFNVTYRALVYNGDAAPIAAEPAAVHAVTAFGHVGFGFSL